MNDFWIRRKVVSLDAVAISYMHGDLLLNHLNAQFLSRMYLTENP